MAPLAICGSQVHSCNQSDMVCPDQESLTLHGNQITGSQMQAPQVLVYQTHAHEQR